MTDVVRPPGPPNLVQVLGPGLTLFGLHGTVVMQQLIEEKVQQAARDGIAQPRYVQVIRAALRASLVGTSFGTESSVATGAVGTSEVPRGPSSAESRVTAEEVAELLDVSPEYVRRLLRSRVFVSAAKPKGRWSVDLFEVTTWQHDRQEARPA